MNDIQTIQNKIIVTTEMPENTRHIEDSTRSRSQNVTLNKRGSNIKNLPYAFTELGVAMLSCMATIAIHK